MAGIERPNMDEPKPGATGGVGGGGEKPPISPGGSENPINPQDFFANAMAQMLTNPAFLDLLGQRLAEQRAGGGSQAERSRMQDEAERKQRQDKAAEKFGKLQEQTTTIRGFGVQFPRYQNMPPDALNEYNNVFSERKTLFEGANFGEALIFIEKLQPPKGPEDRDEKMLREWNLKEATVRRDKLLEDANTAGLFDEVKGSLVSVYFRSRVKVSNKEREGRDEYEATGGTLDKLRVLENFVTDAGAIEGDSRAMQAVREMGIFLGENTAFWSDPKKQAFKETYRGVIDYFNKEGMSTVADVVRNRKRYITEDYPKNGLYGLWNLAAIKDPIGHSLIDEDGKEIPTSNFDDVREAIEEARRQDPWVPNRGDYETWIQFVADDVEELEEMIPYIITKVKKKLGTGEPNSVYQTLTQEKEKMDKALAVFPIESSRQFRRVKSIFAAQFNLMLNNFFSDQFRKDPQPYLTTAELIASSCQDTEYQDHFANAALLDKDGSTMLALEEYSKDDGIFWRYGEKAADTARKTSDVAKLYQYQDRRRREIEGILLGKKLKKMTDLLAINDQGVQSGGLIHPAFQRLKAKFEALDQDDIAHNRPLVDFYGKRMTRWAEYCEKALKWQKNGEFGDPREPQRVIFEHPLARAFRPKGLEYQQGPTTRVDEFDEMFEPDKKAIIGEPEYDKRYAATKRRKVRATCEKAELIARAFMIDSTSALAWFTPEVPDENDLSKIDLIKTQKMVEKFNYYLKPAGLKEISSKETVPYKTLHRVMMQACLREDASKQPTQKRFKFHYLLTKMGADLDLPTFAAWNIGTHDTARPAFMLDGVYNDIVYDANGKEVGLNAALEASMKEGLDEKNTGAKWAEDERRMHLLMQLVVRQMFPKYFNYPGHDTRGAGVKDIRNILDPIYGISKGTSWISDLTPYLLLGEQDPAKDFGASRSPIRQWLGLVKGIDEVTFRQTGYAGIIESPRDMEAWVKRFGTVVEQYKSMTNGTKEGAPGLLKDAPFSGMYLWRDFSLGGLSRGGKYISDHSSEKMYAINHADDAIKDMTETTYRSGIELAGKTAAPLAAFMKHTVESTFGRNPESAKFLNTLLWYAVSKWMDTSPEYRSKPGFAIDGNLHLARYFMHTYLLEDSGLIYSDEEWDQIMLGYVVKDRKKITRYEVNSQGQTKDANGKWVSGTVEEGLIDSFPEKIREEIRKGQEMGMLPSGKLEPYREQNKSIYKTVIKDYWLPFGLKSKYPETFADYYREDQPEDYQGALKQVKSRKEVIRP